MEYSLSGDDIKNYLGKVKIIPYGFIHTYKDIDDLLNPFDMVVILYKTQENYGHWCCLFRRGNQIEFFDPYSLIMDDQLKYSKDKAFRIKNDQDHFYLTRLMYKEVEENPNIKVIYNHYKFQKFDPKITTCGRWCILRLENMDKSLIEFHKEVLLESKLLGNGKNYDKTVVELIKMPWEV